MSIIEEAKAAAPLAERGVVGTHQATVDAYALAAALIEFGERLPGWDWGVGKVGSNCVAECRRAVGFNVFHAVRFDPASALRDVMRQALEAQGKL